MFLAQDADGKQVVLKVFDAPERNQGLFDPKVADEASAYGRLNHPNIVKVVDIFSAEGKFVIALEYVDGTTLAVLRAMLDRDGKKVPDECWLFIMHSVFAALAEAHAAKGGDGKAAPVLHRGVNPSNVLIAWDGTVKLGNFNVAQSVRVLRDSNPGLTWGSYGYFAPEQVKLQPPTSATDVYSGALMLWELLAGKKGLERGQMTDAELLKAMANPSLTPLEQLRRDVAAPVRYAVRAGLEPDPKRRIASAMRIRDVLRAAIELDSARAKLVELLSLVRTHEAATVLPPAIEEPPAPAPATPPPPPVEEPKEEIISLMPDPVSDPPPPPLPPPPAPLPVIEPPPPIASPAAPPVAPPSTPVAMEIAVAPEPALPVVPIAPRKNRGPVLIAALAAVTLIAVVVGALALHKVPTQTATQTLMPTPTPTLKETAAPTVTATASATATATASATVTATATASVTATVTAMVTATSTSTRGTINLPSTAAGHRVFVDGRVMSDGAGPIDVACGHHNVRVGSHGKAQSIDVPCGGTFDLQP